MQVEASVVTFCSPCMPLFHVLCRADDATDNPHPSLARFYAHTNLHDEASAVAVAAHKTFHTRSVHASSDLCRS